MPRRSSRLGAIGYYNTEGEPIINYKETTHRRRRRSRSRSRSSSSSRSSSRSRSRSPSQRTSSIRVTNSNRHINSNIIRNSNSNMIRNINRTSRPSSMFKVFGILFIILILGFGFANLIPTLSSYFLDSGPSEYLHSEPAESPDSGPLDSLNLGPSGSLHSGPSESLDIGPSESLHSGPSESFDSGPSESPDSGPSESQDSGSSESLDLGPSESLDSGPSESLDLGPSESLYSGPSESLDSGPSESLDLGPSESLHSEPSESTVSPTNTNTDPAFEKMAEKLRELQDKLLSLKNKINHLLPPAHTLPNFALESLGAYVSPCLSSSTYHSETGTAYLWKLWQGSLYLRTVIQGFTSLLPGRCWPFKGARGHLVIILSHPVTISHVTLSHISKNLSPTGSISSAPKEFSVYGMKTLDDEGTQLGTFLYDQDGDSVQTFKLPEHKKSVFSHVKLQVESNWGNPDYTCVYSFGVHGNVTEDGH